MSTATFELVPLKIETRGEIIVSNVDEFRELVREALATINRDLKTDEDFGQAEIDVKTLKTAEDSVRNAALDAFDEKIRELVKTLDATAEEIRVPRLELEKLINRRKDEVKAELIAAAMDKLVCAERHRKPVYGTSVADSLKGKRTLDSMRKALDTIVTIHNGTIKKCRGSIESFINAHGPDLVMDAEDLETKSPDSVEAELRRRFEAKKAAEALALQQAETAKAKAAADEAKLALEESTKPPAPPVVQSPPENVEQGPWDKSPAVAVSISESDEWKAFESSIEAALRALNLIAKREALVHSKNKARALVLANAFTSAWSNR